MIQKSELNAHVLLSSIVLIASDTYQLHLVAQKTNTDLLFTEDIYFLQPSVPGFPISSKPRVYLSLRVPVQPQGLLHDCSHHISQPQQSSPAALLFYDTVLGVSAEGAAFLSRVGTDLRAERGLWGINKLHGWSVNLDGPRCPQICIAAG